MDGPGRSAYGAVLLPGNYAKEQKCSGGNHQDMVGA